MVITGRYPPRTAQSYREDLWLSQPYRPEIWIEKSALIGAIEPVCRRWRATAARGYDSHSELYATGKRFQAHLEDRLNPVGLHLGDHDPSGWHMTQNLREEISTYARAPVEVRRLGLNLDQITDLGLPAKPTKEADKRYAAYVCETGQTSSWELDALSPAFIDGLVERAIHGLVDMDTWNEALAHEEAQRERLNRLARRWAK